MPAPLSDLQRQALSRDNVLFNAAFPAPPGYAAPGMPGLLDLLFDTASAGGVGITADSFDVDSLALGGGHFARDLANTTGLTFAYRAGRFFNGLANVSVSAGTRSLSANATNYIEVSSAGVVSHNTTGFTEGRLPLWTVVTGASSISNVTPQAPVRFLPGLGGVVGKLLSSAGKTKELVVPLGTISATTEILIPAPATAGRLVKAVLSVGTTVSTSDTNFWTFELQDRGAAGTGTTAMLLAGDTNTTKLTGGAGLTAYVARTLSLHGTAANLDTAADDVLRFVATKTASAADLVRASLRLDVSFDN